MAIESSLNECLKAKAKSAEDRDADGRQGFVKCEMDNTPS